MSQWFVVREYHELPTVDKVKEVLYCLVNGQEFPIKPTLTFLSRMELFQKVCDSAPFTVDVLLQYHSYAVSEASHIMDIGPSGFG